MKKLFAASVLALGSWVGAAQAAVSITSPATLNLIDFGTGNGGGLQSGATTAAAASGIVFTGSAGVYSGTMANNPSNVQNGYTSPLAGNKNYLAIEPGGSISYTFGSAQTMFGLLFGTIDDYNKITFGTGSTAQMFTGADIAAALGVAVNGSITKNVLFTGLNAFTTVKFEDTSFSAFEFAPAQAVPEPAAWGMMIMGFGLAGGMLRRRPKTKVTFA